MLNLISKIKPSTANNIIKLAARVAEELGHTVRKDKDGACRYFIQTDNSHYIISARSRKKREVKTTTGTTYKAHHAGYMSFYRELSNAERLMSDIPQRDEG
jgi:sensor domain CHASE-containing protein